MIHDNQNLSYSYQTALKNDFDSISIDNSIDKE